jgi:hypothetical protein
MSAWRTPSSSCCCLAATGTRDASGGLRCSWYARYCQETRDVEAAEAQAVLALVSMLAGPRREQAAWALAQLLDRREHLLAAEALLRTWAD